MTQLQSGQTERIVLRLKDSTQRKRECERVFSFFRKILSIKEEEMNQPVENKAADVNQPSSIEPGSGPGFPLDSSRGAQSKEEKPND